LGQLAVTKEVKIMKYDKAIAGYKLGLAKAMTDGNRAKAKFLKRMIANTKRS
jgi:hypothetical protein